MRSRSTNLRTKVIAVLASLTALWAFAAWVTLREGVNLLWVNTLNSKVYEPSAPLLTALQVERRLTLAYLGGPGESRARTALDTQRQETEHLAADFKESAQSWQADVAGSARLASQLDATYASLDALAALRKSVDERTIDRASAAAAFADSIDAIFGVYHATASLDDKEIAGYAEALIGLNRMSEVISQEDALMSGVLASGRITAVEQVQFAQLVGYQRFSGAETSIKLSPDDRARYERMLAGETFNRLRSLEDKIAQAGGTRSVLPVEAAQWRAAVDEAQAELQGVVTAGGNGIVSDATGVAIWVIVRLTLAAGLGAIAVIASILLSITTARALVAQLQRLRDAAHQLADERLPGVVARLRAGEQVDVSAEAPPLDFGDDEIGQVGQAFNRVQETAIRTAVEQAELRRNVREVFLNLARRTQALVHRQVTLLDDMQRQEENPDTLEGLYGVDHLATRMRRNAENLIVLSGATPGRAWRKNVPMIDAVRGAVQEVEDYRRVDVLHIGSVRLAGRSVSDVIHLLAELIENALSFSPPHTRVTVKGQLVGSGYVIEVEDRGLGMSQEDLATANAQINSRKEFNLANVSQLGLFVVSSLSQRHGIRVRLKESPYGGTTAVVLIPAELVSEVPDNELAAASRAGGRAPAAAGRGDGDAQAAANAQPASAIGLADPPAPARRRSGRAWKDLSPSVEPEATSTATGGRPPAAEAPSPDASYTPGGLPMRVRQASLAKQLRDPAAARAGEGADDGDAPRPPEEVRKMMSSYQSGTQRGRTDAARLLDDEPGQAGDPDGRSNDAPAADEQPHT
ncbi:nitrate- and nitrite sensing domain-containing protein [Micromonospora sp. KC723]|uniref:sensor histidine kinase n=1 Tax=Micromonospora sp. KC723 TaxID=2530381 RepID=UPI00104338E2|nr:nitrate- and nitrite sensing domain-containing protein [Micromonospora sp. KC723]TDB72237.1 HAMP domain-containing protein [Micromonospora sp. KC723]